MNFIDLDAEEGKELIKKHECAYVIPTSQSYLIDEGFPRAFVTGWALKFRPRLNGNTAFPLSAHADFIQLTNYVEEAKPKKVYTVHGYKEELANFIRRKLGINAEPIPPLQQTRLGEYL
jgi:Cft2 family RNA processing exonuclease